jgi:myosin-5
VTEYHYANQGNCFKLRQVDDKDEFAATLRAMRVLGFGEENQQAVLRLVAGLLHLGQVAFQPDGKEEGSEVAPDEYNTRALGNFAELCSVQTDYLLAVLTTRVVETRNEQFTVKLRPEQALDARDALAKGLYGRMFNWIVARINAGIATDLRESRASVAVLDIFGFECFLNNSFEQVGGSDPF